MILSKRFTLLGFAGLLALAAAAIVSNDLGRKVEVEAAYDPIPPLHMAVPTEPFVR